MRLFHLLHKESTISFVFVAFIACISGLSNALILSAINAAADKGSKGLSTSADLIMFTIIIGIFIFSQRYILITTVREVENIIHRIRLRIVDKIENAELLPLEQVGRAEIYASVSKETQTISDVMIVLVLMCQSAVLIFFALLYIAWLSLTAFLIFVVFLMIAVVIYFRRAQAIRKAIHDALSLENEFFDGVTHLLDGFKEVKMSEMRQADLHEHIRHISTMVVDMKGDLRSQVAVMTIFTQTTFYLLIALVVFLLPQLSPTYSNVLVKVAAGVLFLVGPISTLVGSLQTYAIANVAAENIEHLEAAINRHVRPMARRRASPLVIRQKPFRDLVFEAVLFDFIDQDGHSSFRLGPIDLAIAPGETLFVTGGNGSGKSTFLRLLTCLYFPTHGALLLDGQRLSETNSNVYRNLFSVIFYDYHLFDRLYGFHDIDPQQVERLLERFQLQGKTRFIDNRFTTLDLSSGQRRRLALVVMYLEDKPVCIFDEWAAEQDPEFRRYFYTEILPELKALGKTVIAVTHDDQYYNMDYVDRILKFEEGRMLSWHRRSS